MTLMKITEVTATYNLSSRTLRYYEQVGLLQSERPPFESYRFYDRNNINRLQQIIVLRKMQIPIRDILRIYEHHDMQTLVQSFVERIAALDEEIHSLSQLKTFVQDFLQAMSTYGITQISALPLLYEKVEDQLLTSPSQPLASDTLQELATNAARPLNMDIIVLPEMSVISSIRKHNGQSDIDAWADWLSSQQIPLGRPGSRLIFEYQHHGQTVLLQGITAEMADCPFVCTIFAGGLFAVTSAYVDEELGAVQQRMMQTFDDNPGYEVDFLHSGQLRHETLIESVYATDISRDKVNIYLPVRQRKPVASDYPSFVRTTQITRADIEQANPILSTKKVDLGDILPIYSPHYEVQSDGEAVFIPWIAERKLDTRTDIRLPFRIDIVYMAESDSEQYLWGTSEGSIWFSHGNCTYTMNGDNFADEALKKHTLAFEQPVLGNSYVYPHIGDVPHDQYNTLTWIVGEQHFAVILNNEIRFCGVNFPYMDMLFHQMAPQRILLGSNGQGVKRFRSIHISQLRASLKTYVTKHDMGIQVKPSNNRLPTIRQIVHPEHGQNYWFNGCAAYLMTCLGNPAYDYDFFAGLTGESFTQIYSKNHFRGNGALDYQLSEPDNHAVIEQIFAQCGYASTFVPLQAIQSNRQMYVQRLMDSIDKGVPVIINDYGNNPHQRVSWGVLVGYADYGKTLFYMGGDATEPDAISLADLLPVGHDRQHAQCTGWLFIGDRQAMPEMATIYRERMMQLPQMLANDNKNYAFGFAAFRNWADDIEHGSFTRIRNEQFDHWAMHSVYICALATNSGGCRRFLEQTLALNPDLIFIPTILAMYAQTGRYWNQDDGNLEALGVGFNATLPRLQDPDIRHRLANVLRAMADCMEEVARVIKDFKEISNR